MRRATAFWQIRITDAEISIHALREEGDFVPLHCRQEGEISIHALREEGDIINDRATGSALISIHALREEGDRVSSSISRFRLHFNPRPP